MYRSRLFTLVLASLPALSLAASCGGDESSGSVGGLGSGAGSAGCGDARVQEGEQCDDGNADESDDCLSSCSFARCGDGFVRAGYEECDDGNLDETDACLSNCALAGCGDGYVQAGVEQCDDGNQEDGDACNSDCTPGAGCGNGTVDAGEECDDGNSSNADGCLTTCVQATCGDGYAQLGVEECDDGNLVDDDGCTNDCHLGQNVSYACPGTAVSVDDLAPVVLDGDTSLSTDAYQGTCGGPSSPEVVYQVTSLKDGVLTATLVAAGGGSDPILYARGGDCEQGAQLACTDSFGAGTAAVTFPVTANGTYWLFADGFIGASGPFTLTVALQTSASGDTCPGNAVSISPGSDVTVSGNTAVAGPHYKGCTPGVNGCPASPPADDCSSSKSTNDIVYAVTPTAAGTLTVSMDPSYDGQLYARSGSCTTGPQLACSESAGVGGLEVISFPVNANTKYSVFADGKSGSKGLYDLTFHLE